MNVASVRFPPGAKNISPDMSPAEIVKSLRRCCKFFSQLDQDQEEEKKIYHSFCIFLAESDLIHEVADATAKIHLGCIFTDIFRLYAPENPFPQDKTKDIFLFITSQLVHLQNTKSAMYSKAFQMLENVAAVKSFIICRDLDNNSVDEIYYELFKVFFSAVNSSHEAQLKARMLDVMVCVLSEGETVPQQVFNILLECLLKKCQKMNSSAHELAKELLRKTVPCVKISVMLFFQNAILGDIEDMSNLMKNWPHLLLELCRISSSFFLDAAPQLEMKLRTDSHSERLKALCLVGNLYSLKDSGLALLHSGLWDSFLARFNDIQSEIRKECVNLCSKIIVNHSPDSLTEEKHIVDLVEQLKLRRHDADETVRSAVIIAIRHIAMQCPHLMTDDLLVFLRERLLDKKPKVRETAIRAVADVNKKFSTDDFRQVSLNQMALLQSHLLRVYYTHNFDDCNLIERMFVGSLVQYSLPEEKRVEKLLNLYCSVDNYAIKAITQMFKRQKLLREAFKGLLMAMDLEGIERNKKIWPIIVRIASNLQNPTQGRDHIKRLVNLATNDDSVKSSLQYLVSDGYTCEKVAHAVRDILKKVENNQDGANKQCRVAVQQLLERTVLVPIIIDMEAMISLETQVKESYTGSWTIGQGNSDAKCQGIDLLVLLSAHDPTLYADNKCFEILLGFLRGKEDNVVEKTLLIFFNTASVIEERFNAVRSILLPELKALATSTVKNIAKNAIRCIGSFTSVRETPLMQIFHQSKQLATESPTPGAKLRSLLTVMGCIAECLPDRAGKEMKGFIATIVVKQIIMKSSTKRPKKKDVKWCEVSAVSEETATKLVAMKCIVRWLHGFKSNESDCCGSTIRLFQHMMHNDGDLMKCGSIPKAEMAHLRLQAALSSIKIAQCPQYKDLISTQLIMEIAGILMDEVREVRQCLLSKLYNSLMTFRVHISFLSLFWVISQEKDKESRDQGMSMYRQLVTRYRSLAHEHSVQRMMPEYALSYTIHLIANDPDLLITQSQQIPKTVLSRVKDSLQFVLDPLLTRNHPESFGFIKRLAELIKRAELQDSKSDNSHKRLYAVCDLVLQTVLTKSAQYAIGIIDPPDEAVKKFLPKKLYSSFSSEENNQNYLPEAFQVEPKLIPVKTTVSKAQNNISKPKQQKLPRKVVAVTKIPVTIASEISPQKTNSVKHAAKSVRHQKRKVPAQECSSSDEECLANKRTRILKEKKKNEETDDSTTEISSQSSVSSASSSSRPRRSTAGSKMMDILTSMKRSPYKSGAKSIKSPQKSSTTPRSRRNIRAKS